MARRNDRPATIRDAELHLLVKTADLALCRANSGDAAAGYEELLYGLQRAEAAQDDGEAYGEELAERCRAAVARYRIGGA